MHGGVSYGSWLDSLDSTCWAGASSLLKAWLFLVLEVQRDPEFLVMVVCD